MRVAIPPFPQYAFRAWCSVKAQGLLYEGNRVGRCGLGPSGSGYGPAAGPCEYGNECSGSIKGEKFLDFLSDYWLLKKNFVPWS